jgi:hypothetical protein
VAIAADPHGAAAPDGLAVCVSVPPMKEGQRAAPLWPSGRRVSGARKRVPAGVRNVHVHDVDCLATCFHALPHHHHEATPYEASFH